MATRVADVFGIPMPEAVHNLLSIFEVLNINIAGIGLPLQCLSLGNYEEQLFFTMLAPLVLSMGLLVAFVIRSYAGGYGGAKAGLLAGLPWQLSLSFLIFPMVSCASFRAFPCEEFANGRAFLRAERVCVSVYALREIGCARECQCAIRA